MENYEALNALENAVNSIKDKKDREFSLDAFSGHKRRYLNDLNIIRNFYKGGKILDIGSSPYHMLFLLKKLKWDVYGIDINPQILRKFQAQHGLKVKSCDIEKEKIPFKDGQFSFIIFNEVFEHLRIDPLAAILEVKRVLKKGGILLLTTPNLYALHKIIMFNTGFSFNNAFFEFNKVKTTGYMGHIREYSNKEIKEILINSGFRVKYTNFENYNNFSNVHFLKRFPLNILVLLFDFILKIIPPFRQYQIVVAIK